MPAAVSAMTCTMPSPTDGPEGGQLEQLIMPHPATSCSGATSLLLACWRLSLTKAAARGADA